MADSNKVEVKQISIHAPARGATKNYLVTVNRFYISIHAPARGATKPTLLGESKDNNFNPRSREGSDASDIDYNVLIIDFNPRSREGSDV